MLDADVCGDSKEYWAHVTADDIKYYCVYHSWWVETDNGYEVMNNFDIIEIERSDVPEDSNLRFVV